MSRKKKLWAPTYDNFFSLSLILADFFYLHNKWIWSVFWQVENLLLEFFPHHMTTLPVYICLDFQVS